VLYRYEPIPKIDLNNTFLVGI